MTIIQSIYQNTGTNKRVNLHHELIKILLRIILCWCYNYWQITLGTSITNLTIDGVRLEGHRVLVKNQRSIEVLLFDVDPNTYFKVII
jgi:hypothetical protein